MIISGHVLINAEEPVLIINQHVVEMECASMLAVSKYRHIPFIQFLYGADNLSSDTWEIRDLNLYGLNNAEKYMVLAFECGLTM